MVRKCSCFVCVICITLAMVVNVRADELLGSIQVIPTWCEIPIGEGIISVSRVGVMTSRGICLTDGLANWYIEDQDLQSEAWMGLALRHTGDITRSSEVLDYSGARFEDLEEGIYLVEQTASAENYAPFAPFLQAVPAEGQWDMILRPKVIYVGEQPKTADRPAPIIGAMGIGLSAAILMVLADRRK